MDVAIIVSARTIIISSKLKPLCRRVSCDLFIFMLFVNLCRKETDSLLIL